ncbi:histidine kinase [Thermomonas sp.]|uniref:sensor histidine kinase n=1 Tax=Thermomonas sp. TaxID=1971895 RepID=UPI002BF0562C|nr:histidine kinase [Thermomonas sp.]HRO64039.1 histidine kinase [Thermomonas sp.]
MNTSTNPLAALWRPPALLSVVLGGEALAAIVALAAAQDGDRLVHFGLASLCVQWVAIGTLCALYLLRRPLGRLPPLRLAWVCLMLLLGMSLLVAGAAWSVIELSGTPAGSRLSFVLRMLGIALVVGLVGLLTYQNYWQSRQLVLRAKQLELEALQARIRPHFLFNTLNTGAALVHQRPDEAERVLLDLADLFRSALRGPRQIPLAEELALTHRYLEIEALRFGPRLRLEWEVATDLPDISVPSLSIQPLAENAIRHGIERLADGGRVEVQARCTPEGVEVIVRNDLPATGSGSGGHAVGLTSARQRVVALTDGRGRIDAGVEDGRFVARLWLPVRPAASPQSA